MSAIDFGSVFEQTPGANLVLSPDLNIVAASDDYLRATMTERGSIVDRQLFVVFPDNPDNPAADGVRNLRASLQRVITDGKSDAMAIQRYDIRISPSGGNAFMERYWSPLNTPVVDESGQLRYIVHHVEDVTALERARRRLRLLTETSEIRSNLARGVALVQKLAADVLDPLAVIETSAYLARQHRNDPIKLDKHIDRINERIPTASQIMGRIVEITREHLSHGGHDLAAELATILEDLDRATRETDRRPLRS